MHNHGVIEGFLLRHVDGSVWVVKGCAHPSDGYVALPRYVGGVKLKKLNESLNYVLRYYRHYMRYLHELGRDAPVVPSSDVSEVLSPLTAASRLSTVSNRLVGAALELLKVIADGCSCTAGISGSLCGGYMSASSDIDIVVYDNHSRCYELIRRLRAEGVLRPMDWHTAFRESIEVSEAIDAWVVGSMTTRNLQGTYNGFRYTIRLVRCDSCPTLGDYIIVPSTEAVVRIADDSLSYTTPSVYVCEVIASTTHEYGFNTVKILTHRIRYSELRLGTLLLVNAPVYLTGGGALINLDLPGTKVSLLETGSYELTPGANGRCDTGKGLSAVAAAGATLDD